MKILGKFPAVKIAAAVILIGVFGALIFSVSGINSQAEQKIPNSNWGSLNSPNALFLRSGSGEQFSGTGGAISPTLRAVQDNALVQASVPGHIERSGNSRDSVTTYIVQSGDSPSVIAASFDITTTTLLWANNLYSGEYIQPGDELTILPVSGVRYTVQHGDTLSGIAQRFGGELGAILEHNNLGSPHTIYPGQEIIIPDGKMPRPKRTYQAPKPTTGLAELDGYFIAPSTGRNWGYLHPTNAVDIANACWTPVYAAAAGAVEIADGWGWNGGYGIHVKINHPNGTATLYAHGIKVVVSAGQEVSQGELIMYMGSTGRSSGCHVHWEVYGAKNPMAWR